MNNINELSNVIESLSTHYTIYKIINNINEKHYIGQHKTNDICDDYMGSGTLIKKAERKYDLSNFTKEILFDFDNFDDMNNKEKELVQLSNCWPYDLMSYNLMEGGSNLLFGKMSKYTIEKISKAAVNRFYNMSKEERLKYCIPLRKGYDKWLSSISDAEYSQIKKDAGNKISITKKRLFEEMTDDEYELLIARLYKSGFLDTAGDKNPMYGEKLSAHMSEAAYNMWLEKITALNKEKAKNLEWLKTMSEINKGENNPMYGHSCTEFMSEDKIKEWKENISKATTGKNNPMFGKSSWENCTIEQRQNRINKFKASIKGKNKGKRCMKLPNETHWKYIKPEEVLKYLDLGYLFYSLNKGKKFK